MSTSASANEWQPGMAGKETKAQMFGMSNQGFLAVSRGVTSNAHLRGRSERRSRS